MSRHYSEIGGTLGEVLLTPTKIYVKPILELISKVTVKGIANITGGGFFENIPRAIKDGLCAKIEKADVQILPIFDLIAATGNIPERDMFNTFNMGVGMVIAVAAEDADRAAQILNAAGEEAYILGELIESTDDKIALEGLSE
jgi:phosphoribosylformylglycinamidine cyclo-ligase